MADRTIAKAEDWRIADDRHNANYVLRVERSAAGQPHLLFIIETYDDIGGDYGCVVVKDGNQFLAPVLEWLAKGWSDQEQVAALAKVIWEASRRDEGSISAMGADIIARDILAHGWNRQAAADKAALLRDVATSLIDWSVMYGHDPATFEDEINHKIAGWIWDKAELLEQSGRTLQDRPEVPKVTYTFSHEDLLNLEGAVSLAIDAHQTGRVQPVGAEGERTAEAHLTWLAALRNDITEQIRGLRP